MAFVKKWLLRLLILIVFLAALIAASENSQEVPLTFLGYQTPEWPVSWWMLAAFVLGILFGLALNLLTNTRLRMNARRASHEARKSTRALDQASA